MMGLSEWQLAWTALVVFISYLIRGMSGFGSSLVAMPLLVMVMTIHTAVPMMGLLAFVLLSVLLVRDWRHVVWGEVWLLLGPTLVGVAVGTLVFATLDNLILLKCLGVVTIAYALYALAVHYFGLPEIRCSRGWAPLAGFCGSAIDTLFGGGGGTIIVAYLHLRQFGALEFRATAGMLWVFELAARVGGDRKSTRLNSSHVSESRMPSSA